MITKTGGIFSALNNKALEALGDHAMGVRHAIGKGLKNYEEHMGNKLYNKRTFNKIKRVERFRKERRIRNILNKLPRLNNNKKFLKNLQKAPHNLLGKLENRV